MEIRNRLMIALSNPSFLNFDFGKTLSCKLESGKAFFYGKKNRKEKNYKFSFIKNIKLRRTDVFFKVKKY